MIYLDSAATTFQKPRAVREAMSWAMNNLGSPGRGGHRYAMDAAKTAFICRERAARLFHVENPENIVFTFNATHGLNIAIGSLISKGDKVVVSGFEHNSVIRPLTAIGARIVPARSPLFDKEAAIEAFERLVDTDTRAVVINHVSNVFGFELPLYEIAAILRERRVPFIIDASQSAGVLDIDGASLGADFIAMPGHKGLYGPQGTGILIVSENAAPLLHGGSGSDSRSPVMPAFLPDRLEAGTHNMPGIAGLAAGLDFILKKGVDTIRNHERDLTFLMARELSGNRELRVYSTPDFVNQTGVLSFEIPGIPSEEVGERLGKMGFAVRAGLHCAPLAHETAGTIREGTVRASVSAFNTRREILKFVEKVNFIAENK